MTRVAAQATRPRKQIALVRTPPHPQTPPPPHPPPPRHRHPQPPTPPPSPPRDPRPDPDPDPPHTPHTTTTHSPPPPRTRALTHTQTHTARFPIRPIPRIWPRCRTSAHFAIQVELTVHVTVAGEQKSVSFMMDFAADTPYTGNCLCFANRLKTTAPPIPSSCT